MKNVLILFLIIFISCSPDEIDISSSTNPDSNSVNDSIDSSLSKRSLEDVYTLEEIDNLITEEFKDYKKVKSFSKSQLDSIIPNNLNRNAQNMMGPYTANAMQTKIRSNEKMILSNGDGGLATDIYFCDIYSFRAEISLPINSIGIPETPSPVGYNNLTEQELGITSYTNNGPTENEFIIYTLTIHVKYNLAGQYINKIIPTSLEDGFEYTYYYVSL